MCYLKDDIESLSSIKELFDEIHILQSNYVKSSKYSKKISSLIISIEKADAEIGAFFMENLFSKCEKEDLKKLEKKLENILKEVYIFHLSVCASELKVKVDKYYSEVLAIIKDDSVNRNLVLLSKAQEVLESSKNEQYHDIKKLCEEIIETINIISENEPILIENQKKRRKERYFGYVIAGMISVALSYIAAIYSKPRQKEEITRRHKEEDLIDKNKHRFKKDSITPKIFHDTDESFQKNKERYFLQIDSSLKKYSKKQIEFVMNNDIYKFIQTNFKNIDYLEVFNFKRDTNNGTYYCIGIVCNDKLILEKIQEQIKIHIEKKVYVINYKDIPE